MSKEIFETTDVLLDRWDKLNPDESRTARRLAEHAYRTTLIALLDCGYEVKKTRQEIRTEPRQEVKQDA